jgi:hypothetical protein
MTHSTAVLFAHVGTWLLRLPPRDESFYWAWQYWSQ